MMFAKLRIVLNRENLRPRPRSAKVAEQLSKSPDTRFNFGFSDRFPFRPDMRRIQTNLDFAAAKILGVLWLLDGCRIREDGFENRGPISERKSWRALVGFPHVTCQNVQRLG